jgi:hypothetical protein
MPGESGVGEQTDGSRRQAGPPALIRIGYWIPFDNCRAMLPGVGDCGIEQLPCDALTAILALHKDADYRPHRCVV